MAASAEDKTFIQDWNSRVKNKEGTDDLIIPQGTTLVAPPDGHSKEQRARRKTPEMKEKDDKRIHFNLHNQFKGADEPIEEDESE